MVDHGDFITQRISGKTIGLRMHEAEQQLVVGRFVDDAQVGAMAVDGVILHSREAAGVHEDISLAIGKLEDIAPGRAGANRVRWRHDVHALVGDVLRKLADESHIGQSVEVAVADDHVFGAGGEDADRIADGGTEMILLAGPQTVIGVLPTQPHPAAAQILGMLGGGQRIPATAHASALSGFRIRVLHHHPARPQVSLPDELSLLNRVVRSFRHLDDRAVRLRLDDAEFRHRRSFEVEHQVGVGYVLAMVVENFHHPAAVEDFRPGGAARASLQPQMLHIGDVDADRLGLRRRVAGIGHEQRQSDGVANSKFMHAGQEFDDYRFFRGSIARRFQRFSMEAWRNDHLVAGGKFDGIDFGN